MPLPPLLSGNPAGEALQRGQPEGQSQVLTVSGVLRLGGLHGGAVGCGWGGGGTVSLGFADQHGQGVVRVHHLQRLRTERAQSHTTVCGKKAQLQPSTQCTRCRTLSTRAHTASWLCIPEEPSTRAAPIFLVTAKERKEE